MKRIHGRHQGIVEMAGTVPYAVAVVDANVAHLHRQEILQSWLPHMPVKNIAVDLEGLGFAVGEGNDIHAAFPDIGKVEKHIVIAQELAPLFRQLGQDCFQLSRRQDAFERCRLASLVSGIALDHRHFPLPGIIADL
jgi:hypothetical protein